jgi:PhnB protein
LTVIGVLDRLGPYLREAMQFASRCHCLGGSVVMIGDELPGGVDPSPKTLGGSPVALFVYVEDVDDVFKRAVEAGANVVQPPEDHFYGDRVAMFDDPFGHRWNVATHTEDVPPEEMERRAASAMAGR